MLPFQNMSGDPEQEYFADGMVEDIITALSRFKSLFVIARNSSFTYKGQRRRHQAGRTRARRALCAGRQRAQGGRSRADHRTAHRQRERGAHLWADRFDGALEDVFDLQDQVTASVVGAIAPEARAGGDRARRTGSRPRTWTLTTASCVVWQPHMDRSKWSTSEAAGLVSKSNGPRS